MKPVILPMVGVLLLTAACSADPPPAAQPTATATRTPACPAPGPATLQWPPEVPADLPKPPGAVLKAVQRREGITSVRFSTPTPLLDSLIYVLRELPQAGFTQANGDAEPLEADVPFGRGGLTGLYRMIKLGRCSTDWLVAVTLRKDKGPFLQPQPGPSSTPLPFG